MFCALCIVQLSYIVHAISCPCPHKIPWFYRGSPQNSDSHLRVIEHLWHLAAGFTSQSLNWLCSHLGLNDCEFKHLRVKFVSTIFCPQSPRRILPFHGPQVIVLPQARAHPQIFVPDEDFRGGNVVLITIYCAT